MEKKMAGEELKEHNQLVGNLESMADGINKHSAEENFPNILVAENARAQKAELENAREQYNQAETNARALFDAYNAKKKNLKEQYSKYIDALYSKYGKKDQVLTDFGVKPIKTSGAKGPRKKNTQ